MLVSITESALPSSHVSMADLSVSPGSSGAQAPNSSGAVTTYGEGTKLLPRNLLTSSSSFFFSSSKRARSSDSDSIKSLSQSCCCIVLSNLSLRSLIMFSFLIFSLVKTVLKLVCCSAIKDVQTFFISSLFLFSCSSSCSKNLAFSS